MQNNKKPFIKMAVQTVLHQYKPFMNQIEENPTVFNQINEDIEHLTTEMEQIAQEVFQQKVDFYKI